jgi:hypothetical protein
MPRTPLLALLAGALSALLGACVLDLGDLSSGGAASSGGEGGGGVPSSASGGGSDGGGGDAGCPLLDCACASGPTVLASGATFTDLPRGIALASDGLYWASQDGDTLVRIPSGGGPPEAIVST